MPRGTPRRSSTALGMDDASSSMPPPAHAMATGSSGGGVASTSMSNGGPARPAGGDDPKYTLATAFLQSMLHEVVLDTALETHGSVTRQRKRQGLIAGGCPVCRKACLHPEEHAITGADSNGHGANGASGTDANGDGSASGQGNGSTAPSSSLAIYSNNPLLACIVCSRQVSANRYAQHLASCVGVGKGAGIARRKPKHGSAAAIGAANGTYSAAAKIRLALENRKRTSYPLAGSVSRSRTSTPAPSGGHATSSNGNQHANGLGSSLSQPSSLLARRSPLAGTSSIADGEGGSHTVNANGKRSASPSTYADGNGKKMRTDASSSNRPSPPATLLSSISQPAMASPLNPNRQVKSLAIESDSDEDGGRSGLGAASSRAKSRTLNNDESDDDDVSLTMHKRAAPTGKSGRNEAVPSSSQPGNSSAISVDDEDDDEDDDGASESYNDSGSDRNEEESDAVDAAPSSHAGAGNVKRPQMNRTHLTQSGTGEDDEDEDDEDEDAEEDEDGDEDANEDEGGSGDDDAEEDEDEEDDDDDDD